MTHPQPTWEADYGHAAGQHESRAAIQSHDSWYWNIGDDIDAAMYYGSLGLYDPTNVADIPMWKKAGYSTRGAIGLMLGRAVLPALILGFIIDPMDKREGGLAESEWYQETAEGVGGFWDWLWSGKDIDIYT